MGTGCDSSTEKENDESDDAEESDGVDDSDEEDVSDSEVVTAKDDVASTPHLSRLFRFKSFIANQVSVCQDEETSF